MNAKLKIVYVISERNSKHYWSRVGAAFVNSDGSINVKLDAIPVSGELQIRDYIPRAENSSAASRDASIASFAELT